MLQAEIPSELFGDDELQHVGMTYCLLYLHMLVLVKEYLDGIQQGPETEELEVSFHSRAVIFLILGFIAWLTLFHKTKTKCAITKLVNWLSLCSKKLSVLKSVRGDNVE